MTNPAAHAARLADQLGSPGLEQRVRYSLVKMTLAAAMAAGMLLSPKLWLTERHYPHVPVWDGLPTIHPPGDRLIFGAMLLLLGLAAALPRRNEPVLAFVVLAGVWSLWDQSRWQPWFYQYLFMLAAVGWCGMRGRRVAGLSICRLVLAATYFWSGLQKFNVGFVTDVFPWIMEPVLRLTPETMRGLVAEMGWYAAYTECCVGVLLLIPRWRRVAVPLLIVMHAVILYCLSPRGHNWNSVVWPWNIAMIALNVLLFARTRRLPARLILWPRRVLLARVVLVLFGVMPLFNFVGWWDDYLSAVLYSGNTVNAKIQISAELAAKLPPEVRDKHVIGQQLDVTNWSLEEMNVPDYPARRVYRGIARRLSEVPGDVILEIEERPHWQTGARDVVREELGER